MKRTYTYRPVAVSDIAACDLQQEMRDNPGQWSAYIATLHDDNGPIAEAVEVVILDGYRAGIAYGADADWTDCTDIDDALRCWIDDEMMP